MPVDGRFVITAILITVLRAEDPRARPALSSVSAMRAIDSRPGPGLETSDADADVDGRRQPGQVGNALARLVHLLSKPGAFKRIDAILGENVIEESVVAAAAAATAAGGSCPSGEEGLECRRAEARRSLDCPRGDCHCHSCASVGPRLWESCCRDSLRCCSHLAAACRTCDQPALYSFCSKHFNKCRS